MKGKQERSLWLVLGVNGIWDRDSVKKNDLVNEWRCVQCTTKWAYLLADELKKSGFKWNNKWMDQLRQVKSIWKCTRTRWRYGTSCEDLIYLVNSAWTAHIDKKPVTNYTGVNMPDCSILVSICIPLAANRKIKIKVTVPFQKQK